MNIAVRKYNKNYSKICIKVLLITFVLLGIIPSVTLSQVNPADVPVFSYPNEVHEPQLGAQLVQGSSLIGAAQFRQECGVNGAGYAVAVIDTGVDYNHPNLGGGWGNRVVAGYDFVNNDANPMDDNGHGTHVAGIIASNHSTYTGVAPGANIVALKVLAANGSGNFAAVESALQWVIANRATYNIVAINLSLGAGNYTSNPYSFLEDEFTTLLAANVQIYVASGNSFYGYSSVPGLAYPAISDKVVSIGAVYDANVGQMSYQSGAIDYTTAADRITSFTQRHSLLSFMSPGSIITSTQLGGGFVGLSGTSMAAPIAAAAGTLIRAALDSLNSVNIHQDDVTAALAARAIAVNDGDNENDNVTNTGQNFLRITLDGVCEDISGDAPPPLPSVTPSQTPSAQPSQQPSASASQQPSASPSPSVSASISPSPSASPSPSTSPEPTPETVPELVRQINAAIPNAFRARTPTEVQAAITEINNLLTRLIALLRSYNNRMSMGISSVEEQARVTQKLIKALQRYKKLVVEDRTPDIRSKLKIARQRVNKFTRQLESLD